MRIKFLRTLYLLFFLAITLRLFYWQVLRSDDLKAMAEGQRFASQTLQAPRGQIFFNDGSVLASNRPNFLLYGLPKVIKDKELVVSKLGDILLPLEYPDPKSPPDLKQTQEFKDSLRKQINKDLYWVPIYKNVDLETKQKISALNLQGLGFDSSLNRYYPEGSSSAHLLGFVADSDSGKQVGYFGLEGFYNGELTGVEGSLTQERDAKGLPILIGNFFEREAKNGFNLNLNVDRSVQYIVEKNLKAGIVKYGAKSASAIIMDPKTGAVLAMANYPNYDPSHIKDFPKDFFKNPIVADAYEPGSTFKVLVMAAAINEGVVKPETVCDICAGPVSVGGFVIHTWNNKYNADTTMTETIIHSDNTGMVFVGRKLGLDKLYDYLQKYGLGSLTKIDLQDETTPDFRPKDEWHDVDLATATFGQGLAVTAMQMVRAVGMIANNGNLMEPHIVHSIQTDKRLIEIKPKVVATPITPQTALTITQMMVDAVDKGEAQFFKPKGFKIAGKTGTAQIPVAGHYDPNKTIASFVGFAPADDPKFVMLVRYEQPTSSIYGAETAAPTFFDIAKELFRYYNITPQE